MQHTFSVESPAGKTAKSMENEHATFCEAGSDLGRALAYKWLARTEKSWDSQNSKWYILVLTHTYVYIHMGLTRDHTGIGFRQNGKTVGLMV